MPEVGHNTFDRQHITKAAALIALPLAAQSIVNFLVNLLDTLMLGQLGEVPLSAASLGNQVFLIVMLVSAGIAAGSNVLSAQYWGQRDVKSIHRVLAYTYRVSIAFVVIITAAGILFPGRIMELFTNDSEIVAEGAQYLRIVAFCYPFYILSIVTTGVLQAVHTVKIAVAGSWLALMIKVALNWGLIFGSFGMPALGIKGAAVATLVSRICEFGLILWFVYFREDKLKIRIHKLIPLDKSLAAPYFSISTPVVCNELFWALGASVLSMILGHMGREVISANSIYSAVSQLTDVMVTSLSSAACVMIANTIGAGDEKLLESLKHYFYRLSIIIGLLAFGILFTSRFFVIDFYHVSETTKAYAGQIMMVGSITAFFSAVQLMNMMGILRGGGDVVFAMANDLILLWAVMVPLGFLAAFIWSMPVPVVFFVIKSDQVIKVFTSAARVRSGKWKRNFTKKTKPEGVS